MEKAELQEDQNQAIKYLKQKIEERRQRSFPNIPRLYRNYDHDKGLNSEMFAELQKVNLEHEASSIAHRLYGFNHQPQFNEQELDQAQGFKEE